MTTEFDKLISDAAPEVPDWRIDRRTARELLHKRMHRHERRRQWLHAPSASLAAGLVLLALVGGMTTELGSDAFEFETGETVVFGEIRSTKQTSVLGGRSWSNSTPERAAMFEEAAASGQVEVQKLLGYEIDGAIFWVAEVRAQVDGKWEVYGDAEQVPSSRYTEQHKALLSSPHFPALARSNKILPPDAERPVVVDGIPVTLKTWAFTVPGIGEVLLHRGFPREPTE